MERAQATTWSSERPPTFHGSQQRQQFYSATANLIQLPPVSPMQHQLAPSLGRPAPRHNQQNFGFAPSVLQFDGGPAYAVEVAQETAPYFAPAQVASYEPTLTLHGSHHAPAEQAWDMASSNASRLMAKLSHLKSTIRSVRERSGDSETLVSSEMQGLPPLSLPVWVSGDQLAENVHYSEPQPPPSSPPLSTAAAEEDPAFMNIRQLNRVLPSPPEVFSPSKSAMKVHMQHAPDAPAFAAPRVQMPHPSHASMTPRSDPRAVQQPSPDPPEVDSNLQQYISSLEQRVTALTFENNKLRKSNESMHMTIKSMSDAAQGGLMHEHALWQQQQQQLKAALEQRVSSLQRQSELVHVFDAACVKQAELIGDGSFGQVRMGQLTVPVAVKTARRLSQGSAAGPDAAREISVKQEEQLFREASLQGALRHPGVVAALGICITEGGQVALITELVKGRSLEDILHSKKIALSMQETITIATQLADALAYLHHRSVVHRDVKPGNILVSSDMIVKLCDFGLACRLQGRISDHVPRAGTPVYLAPETLSNKSGSVNEPVDVYSFAIVCWEMCTGQQIWSELVYSEMEQQVLSGNRPPIPPHVHAPFANLIRACWEQNPADRPNFRAILHMLRKMGGELPPQAAHGVYFSRDNFHRILHGERSSHPGTPMPSALLHAGLPALSDMASSSSARHLPPTSSATATPTRAPAAGVSAPATPRRWEGGGSARQGDTIVI